MSRMWTGVFERLDQISRKRTLTDRESGMLEIAINRIDLSPPVVKPVYRPWTADEDAMLMECVANDFSFRGTADAVGRTRNSCISRFNSLKRKMGWQAA